MKNPNTTNQKPTRDDDDKIFTWTNLASLITTVGILYFGFTTFGTAGVIPLATLFVGNLLYQHAGYIASTILFTVPGMILRTGCSLAVHGGKLACSGIVNLVNAVDKYINQKPKDVQNPSQSPSG